MENVDREWFSAMVRLAILIEGSGSLEYDDVVYVFRATDFDDAVTRAVDLGSAAEREYRNADGRLVRWRLTAVMTLDQVGPGDLDGAEVWSQFTPIPPEEKVGFEHVYHPAASRPGQAGVPFRSG